MSWPPAPLLTPAMTSLPSEACCTIPRASALPPAGCRDDAGPVERRVRRAIRPVADEHDLAVRASRRRRACDRSPARAAPSRWRYAPDGRRDDAVAVAKRVVGRTARVVAHHYDVVATVAGDHELAVLLLDQRERVVDQSVAEVRHHLAVTAAEVGVRIAVAQIADQRDRTVGEVLGCSSGRPRRASRRTAGSPHCRCRHRRSASSRCRRRRTSSPACRPRRNAPPRNRGWSGSPTSGSRAVPATTTLPSACRTTACALRRARRDDRGDLARPIEREVEVSGRRQRAAGHGENREGQEKA